MTGLTYIEQYLPNSHVKVSYTLRSSIIDVDNDPL